MWRTRIFKSIYRLLLLLLAIVACGCSSNSECRSNQCAKLVGTWFTKRLPLVRGVTRDEYITKYSLLGKDTILLTGFCFLNNGKAHYYPYIQSDGKYIPGNRIEGRWDVHGKLLYFAEGTLPLTAIYEIEMRDSILLLHQTKQMQRDYIQVVISECNKRISRKIVQHDFLEYASVLSRFTEQQRILETLPNDFSMTYCFVQQNAEPKEITDEQEADLIAPKKEPRYQYTE